MSCINTAPQPVPVSVKRRGKHQQALPAEATTVQTQTGTELYFAEQGLPNPQETVYKPRQRRQKRQLRVIQQQQEQQPAAWPYAPVQYRERIAAEQLVALATQQEQELTEYNKRLKTMEDRVRILVNTASTMMTETHNLNTLCERLEKSHLDLCASIHALHDQYQSPDPSNGVGTCSEEAYASIKYEEMQQQQQQQQPHVHMVSTDQTYIPFSMGFYDKTSMGMMAQQQYGQQPQTILSTAAQLLRTSCNT
jgi:hypothetical protein